MKRNLLLLAFVVFATGLSAQQTLRYYYPLNGTWRFALDPQRTMNATTPCNDEIELPGTTDTNRKGFEPENKQETTHLTRLHSYVGRAWYKRAIKMNIIPIGKGFSYILHMERTKPSTVYIDGKEIGSSDNVSTPQEYDITEYVKSGSSHQLCIMIDNSTEAVPPQVVSNSHAYTEDTQTNWNGVLGKFYIELRPSVYIKNISIETSAERNEVVCTADITGKIKKDMPVEFILAKWGSEYGVVVSKSTVKKTKQTTARIRVTYQHDGLVPWSEFHPQLYRMIVKLGDIDVQEKQFGLCDFTTRGTQFCVNGHTTFLRGKHDAACFPRRPTYLSTWRSGVATSRYARATASTT